MIGFNFTAAMRGLCADMCRRLPELAHVDLQRVAIAFCQARKGEPHGLQAALTPLHFEGGAETTQHGGRCFTCQTVVDAAGRPCLYILSFYLPRFLNHSLEEKLSTILHELWHISPTFDGDLRRHVGRYYAHGASQQRYDAAMQKLACKWLSLDPPYELYEFLEHSFSGLAAEHGSVFGERFAVPQLVTSDDFAWRS
jgi:hypothetical protein